MDTFYRVCGCWNPSASSGSLGAKVTGEREYCSCSLEMRCGMTVSGRELVKSGVFANEGTKLGKIRSVIVDPESSAEYLAVGRFLSPDLIIPAAVAERSEYRVEVPFSASYLDMAPILKAKGVFSTEERRRLEEFYRAHAA
jgi:PRC-barrel domain